MTNGIEFTISTHHKEYLLGTPITCHLEIHNAGSKSVSLSDQLHPEFDIVKFEIKKEDKKFLFRPYTILDAAPHIVSLEPSKSITASAKLFYGADKWTFKEPGRYQVKASYNGLVDEPNQVMESNEIELDIRPPTNKEEKEQVNLIMGDEQGRFLLLEGGDHLTNGIDNLTELATKYPQSDLAKYANFSLGINTSAEFADYTKMQVRKPDIKKSVSHLENAKPKLHGYYAKKTYFTLAKLYDESNNKSAKKNTLKEFVDRFSDDSKYSDSVSNAKSMLEESS
jgi:hypothetical protein